MMQTQTQADSSPQTRLNPQIKLTPISTLARMYQIRLSARAVAEAFNLDKHSVTNSYYSVRRLGISRFSPRYIYEKMFNINLSVVDKNTLDLMNFYRLNFSVQAATDISGVARHIVYSVYIVCKLNHEPKFKVREIYTQIYGTPPVSFDLSVTKKNKLIILKLKTQKPLQMTSALCQGSLEPLHV